MNSENGEVYQLEGLRAENGDLLTKQLLAGVAETEARARALSAMERGEKVVAVADEVAHAQLVGQRELERRRRRRRSGSVVGS